MTLRMLLLGKASAMRRLSHARTDVRRTTAMTLFRMGWQPQTEADKAAYLAASEAWEDLAAMGLPAMQTLTRLLSDDDTRIRACVASALRMIRDPKAVDALMALAREHPDVTDAVVAALGRIGSGEAIGVLISMLSTYDRNAVFAITALGGTRDPRAVWPLIKCLGARSEHVREQAARALGDIGDPSAIPALQRLWRETPVAHVLLRVAASDAIRRIAPGTDPGGADSPSWLPWEHEMYVPRLSKPEPVTKKKKEHDEKHKRKEDEEDGKPEEANP
jgi:hypothetical protein